MNMNSESLAIKKLQKIINECVGKCLRKYLHENVRDTLNGIQYLYHATPACYINSIKKYGLGGKMPKNRLWDYKDTTYENITQGCFLATDEYVAESYVETSEAFEELAEIYEERYNKELDVAVFRINVNDLNINLLSIDTNQQLYDDNVDPTYFYNGVIPFNKLTRIKLY